MPWLSIRRLSAVHITLLTAFFPLLLSLVYSGTQVRPNKLYLQDPCFLLAECHYAARSSTGVIVDCVTGREAAPNVGSETIFY